MSLLLHLINIQQMLFVVPNIKKTRLLSIIITLELQGKKKSFFLLSIFSKFSIMKALLFIDSDHSVVPMALYYVTY